MLGQLERIQSDAQTALLRMAIARKYNTPARRTLGNERHNLMSVHLPDSTPLRLGSGLAVSDPSSFAQAA
jgi:hypothetical protein